MTDPTTSHSVQVVAIISETGEGLISGQDGTYYHLNIAQSGNNVSGSFSGYSTSVLFADGSLSTSGSMQAVVGSAGLNGTLTDQSGNVENLELSYDNVYTLPSSLPTLAGNWSYSANGFTLTAMILQNGSFTATDSNGCSYSGTFSLIDPTVNVYADSYTLMCNGTRVVYSGLASYFPSTGSTVPAQIKFLADDGTGQYLAADLQQ